MIRYNEEKKANEICLVEIFSSLSGEAYNAGIPACFIRTFGCNLRCCFGSLIYPEKINHPLNGFCDTPESFTKKNFKMMYPEKELLWLTAEEIFHQIETLEKGWKFKNIIISGGEPCLEENEKFLLNELLPLFYQAHYDIGLETNGSIDYTPYKKKFGKAIVFDDGHRQGLSIVADWKLPSSKMTAKMLESNLVIYDETDIIKVVVSDDPKDWKELDRLIKLPTQAAFYLSPMYQKVDTEKLWHYVEKNADKKIKVQIQLHKYMFKNPNEKGV